LKERVYVEFESLVQSEITVTIRDVAGKVVSESEQISMAGWNSLCVTGLASGNYIVEVRSAEFCYSGKLISINDGSGVVLISKVSLKHHDPLLKSSGSESSVIQMQYNDGEQLLLTGYSGIYATIVPLIPTDNMTLTFNFVECTDADGNNYPVVGIGTQVWMAQNLNIGTRINGSDEQTDNQVIEKYCYDDLESNCDVYGGLYQWDEMMQYVTTEGTQGICPAGWHVPTDGEWIELTNYLGGEGVAGGMMKESGITHWSSPNTGATNSSGFTALPGGARDYDGSFNGITYNAYFWSSTVSSFTNSWYWFLYYEFEFLCGYPGDKTHGFSCRCMKDN